MQQGGEQEVLQGVKKTILVLSGKGGVGKSTVAVQLALAHQQAGLKVGILDIDLCGPSVPRMLGVNGSEIHQSSQDDAVIWRGPKKNAMIKQFLTDVAWGDRDVLIIDTPPGTSDEHITVMEALRGVQVEGAVLVTTPQILLKDFHQFLKPRGPNTSVIRLYQAVAVGDVRRELTFCRKTGLKVLGIVENMSGYVCPHCSTCTNVFSSGGGKALAEHAKVPFLGCVPLEPQLALAAESGSSFVEKFSDSKAAQSLVAIYRALQGESGRAEDEKMEP